MRVVEGSLDAAGLRVAVVASRFNEAVVERLVTGALGALRRHGAVEDDLTLVWVPGAWELALVARRLAERGDVDAIVAVGAVVRGETAHFEHVATAAAAVAGVGVEAGVPVAFGVLTTETWQQAVDRAGGKLGNKGAEAALAAVEAARVLAAIGHPPV